MTKTLLLSTCLLIGFGANAQYVLTQAGAPKVGDFNFNVTDTIPQVTKGTAGANQFWDFTNFDLNVDDVSTWADATTAPNGADFPTADLELNGSYFDVTATRMELIGVAIALTGEPQATPYSNTESIFRFPSTYMSTYQDTSQYRASFYIGQMVGTFQVDSARVTAKQTKTILFDAWGTITTPTGYFSDVIRERTYAIVENTTEACLVFIPGSPCSWVNAGTLDPSFAGGTDTTITYAWYNQVAGTPVASIVYDKTDATPISATINNDPNFTSVKENAKSSMVVYPNPTTDLVYFRGADVSSVKISDLQGRVILSNSVANNRMDVSSLSAGNYLVTVVTTGGVKTEKLSVIK